MNPQVIHSGIRPRCGVGLAWFTTKSSEATDMTREETIERLRQCETLAMSSQPMTREEIAAHRSRCAEERARAEAAQHVTEQLDLLEQRHGR